jgi:hypothetical protein
MSGSDQVRVRQVARNLIEVLSTYEEELIALERSCPQLAQVRRAVGMAIAEACYLISDETAEDWDSQADDSVRRLP